MAAGDAHHVSMSGVGILTNDEPDGLRTHDRRQSAERHVVGRLGVVRGQGCKIEIEGGGAHHCRSGVLRTCSLARGCLWGGVGCDGFRRLTVPA